MTEGGRALFVGLFGLRGVGDGGDYEAVATDAIKDGIRSATDDELPDAGFRSDSAEIGMNSQCFDDRNDASGQALGGVRLVQGYEGPNFLKASEGQRRILVQMSYM